MPATNNCNWTMSWKHLTLKITGRGSERDSSSNWLNVDINSLPSELPEVRSQKLTKSEAQPPDGGPFLNPTHAMGSRPDNVTHVLSSVLVMGKQHVLPIFFFFFFYWCFPAFSVCQQRGEGCNWRLRNDHFSQPSKALVCYLSFSPKPLNFSLPVNPFSLPVPF